MRTRSAALLAAIVLAGLFLASCSQESMLNNLSSAEDRALSLDIIHALQSGDTKKVTALMDQKFAEQLAPALPKMRAMLPAGPGTTITHVDAAISFVTPPNGPTVRISRLAYEVAAGKRYVLVQLGFERASAVRLVGLYAVPLPRSTGEMFAFSFTGKPLGHYLFLLIALISFATIVTALFVLYRATNVRGKWLWAIGSLCAVGQVAMNWSTGAIAYNLTAVQVFGAFAGKNGMLAPWYVGFGLPIVAYWFLIRQAIKRRDAPKQVSDEFD